MIKSLSLILIDHRSFCQIPCYGSRSISKSFIVIADDSLDRIFQGNIFYWGELTWIQCKVKSLMCDTLQSTFAQIRLGRLGLRIHRQGSCFAFIIPELSSKSTQRIISFENFMFLLRQGFIFMLIK